jgi:hypothetical protein
MSFDSDEVERRKSPEQRLELTAFLAELEDRSEIDFERTVDHRMKAMDAGNKVTSQEFEAEHRRTASFLMAIM